MELFHIVKDITYLSLFFFACHVDFTKLKQSLTWKTPDFIGEEHWTEDYLDLCNDPAKDNSSNFHDSLCYVVNRGFVQSRIEVLSWFPPLLVYRDMFSEKQVTDYLKIFNAQILKAETVVGEEGNDFISNIRRANGTVTPVENYTEARSLVDTAAWHIPQIDFEIAETMTGLSYLPGGHYAPHYDYFVNEEDANDELMQSFGNRMATFIFVFQAADAGGGTVFPELQTTVKANAGDGILWFNEKENMDIEPLVMHAGCPVYAGRKIIGTIWLRTYGQPLFEKYWQDQSFDAAALLF